MHRSRIGVVLIDHPATSYDGAASFWAAATGSERERSAPPSEEPYEPLNPWPGGMKVELQHTGDDTLPRVHFDIETDDVPAEVERVLALGARIVEERRGYTILADPGGLLFCVVPVQTGAEFDAHAVTWP